MKILVLGASGMAGHVITTYFREKGYEVTAVAGSMKLDREMEILNVTDNRRLIEFLDSRSFDLVINCIGVLVAASERKKSQAILINAFLPHFLEEYYRNTHTRVFHLSTDCVFSGGEGPYKLEDVPNSQTFYGRAKALGEIKNDKDLTLRMSIIGPEIRPNGVGLFNWFMMQQGEIKGYRKVYWNGITTLELAQRIETIIQHPLYGIHHFSMEQPINKYDLLILFKQIMNKEDITIEASDVKVSNKVLIPSQLAHIDGKKSYQTMLSELAEWMKKHSYFYPHYNL